MSDPSHEGVPFDDAQVFCTCPRCGVLMLDGIRGRPCAKCEDEELPDDND